MKAARWHNVHDVRIEDVEVPRPPEGFALIRVGACGVCGTDIHEFESGPHFLQAGSPHPRTGTAVPLTIGHEFAGVVEDVGSDRDSALVGKLVAVDVVDSCGSCSGCRSGNQALCDTLAFLGSHCDGGMAQYAVAQVSSLVQVSEDTDPRVLCLADPVATALHAVRRVGTRLGDSAWVSGCGPIGLSVIQWLRLAGVKEIHCYDPNNFRTEMARSLGATESIPRPHLGRYDVAFETSGVDAGLESCCQAVRNRGHIAAVSIWGSPPRIDLNRMVTREAIVVGCLAYDHAEFSFSANAIASRAIKVEPYVTDVVGLQELVSVGLQRPSVDTEKIKTVIVPNGR